MLKQPDKKAEKPPTAKKPQPPAKPAKVVAAAATVKRNPSSSPTRPVIDVLDHQLEQL